MTYAILVVLVCLVLGVAVLLRRGAPTQGRRSLAIPHRNYAGRVIDPNRTLLGRDLESVEVSVRSDLKATVKLVCEDGSYVSFAVEAT